MSEVEMEESKSSVRPEQGAVEKEDAAAEERFIAQYTRLTGGSAAQARNVYMYFDIIRHRDPYCYRLE
jgi:hypothetical protein